jgi:hypothetical protein
MSKRKQLDAQLAQGTANASGPSHRSEISPSLPYCRQHHRSMNILEDRPSEIARPRLSLQGCKSLLGLAGELTDAQVLKLRDSLYDLANVLLEGNRNGKRFQ